MALINCPNCGKKVSDRAKECPHCGIDIKTFKVEVLDSSEKEKKPDDVNSTLIQEEPRHEEFSSTSTSKANEASTSTEALESNQEKVNKEEIEEENVISKKKSSHAWIWVLVVSLIVILAGCGVGGYFYYQNVYLPEKIDREAPRTYPIVNVFVRSSKDSGGEYNKVGLVPYGGELITYKQEGEWSKVKYIPVDPTQPVLEGYAASSYLMPKSDFDLLNGIFGNDEARQVIESAKCRRAILNYFKDNGLIGKAVDGDIINPRPTDENQWQIFLSSATEKPNEVFFKRVINPNSKFTDFAVVLKNVANNKGRILYFTFDDDETPHLIAEYELPTVGKITDINYNSNRPNNLGISTTVGTPFKIGSNPLEGYTYEGDGHMGAYIKIKIKFVSDHECLLYRTYGGYGMETNFGSPEQCTYLIKDDEVIIDNNDDWRDLILKIVKNGSGLEYRNSECMNLEYGATGWLDLSRL